ncbi:alpha/beta hydrolase [Pikeienuella piscinae]|uniref:Alpha/beta hydrolase n=2 Tax=Pikeienuella piscinae TaxID=2748098 RepID=A0A7M3T762_9RHOB|nr:alpha/beta hydrolase [Pikeienuella piscinae]
MGLALRLEGADRLSAMLRGLRLYQASPIVRTLPDPPAIWRRGAARLLDFGPEGGRPVLVAPSLINRHHILDLDEGASLMSHLAGAGLRPLLLDWGAPEAEERGFGLSDYVERRLLPAFDAAHEAFGGRIALTGYCMGGALAVALAGMRAGAVSRLALIGAPWDFAHMTPMRGALAALGATGDRATLERMIEGVAGAFGATPVTVLQAVFAQLDPGLAARKFRRFAKLDQKGAEARRFVLIEDWLNAGPPLSGPATREALIDWHLENATMRGRWRVAGEPVRPEAVRAPVLVAAARQDRITPPAATEAVAAALGDVRIIRPASGHVGMIVGRGARAALWRPLADFLSA